VNVRSAKSANPDVNVVNENENAKNCARRRPRMGWRK
jgi:hypothetical protein